MLRNKHVTRFGNPSSPLGATYVVSDEEGLLLTAIDLEYLRLYVDEVPITPALELRIQDRARRELVLLHHKLSQLGIPASLRGLFEMTTKGETEKYCKNLQFTEFDFFLLIHNYSQLGLSYYSKFPEYVPEHLTIPKIGSEQWEKEGLKRIARKSAAIMRERRRIHMHLFERGEQWHCFYYSYADIPSDQTAHWKHGDHLHYFNYLWTNYSKDQVLKLFDARKTKVSDKVHIRFRPFEYPPSFPPAHKIPETLFGSQPMLAVVNSNLPLNPNFDPIPIAQLATRGFWSFEISTPSPKASD